MSTIFYAKLVGLFGSGIMTGATLFLSAIAVPSMHLATTPPVILQRQWQALYDSGKTWFPPTVVLTSVAFAEVAWLTRRGGAHYGAWEPWAVSATATVAIIPFTLLFMMPDIRQLEEARGKENNNLPGLLANWSWLNMVRAGLHAVAFGTSLWMVCA